jgi:hypothetical protein
MTSVYVMICQQITATPSQQITATRDSDTSFQAFDALRILGEDPKVMVAQTKKSPLRSLSCTRALDWLTVYRQLFAWIVAFNVVVVVLSSTKTWKWAHTHRVQFALANTLICVLARNEVGQ